MIYIRNLFQDLKSRGINYINDINLVALLESIKENCKILKEAVIRIFEKRANNLIQFDLEKTELIHFHSKRNISKNVNIYFSENYLVEAKPTVKWLKIWLDSKLNFKEYMKKKGGAGDQNLSPNKKTIQYKKRTIISSSQTVVYYVYNINYRL